MQEPPAQAVPGPTCSPLVQPFYPALDGLRAIAILSVMALHFGLQVWWAPAVKWGWVGVDLFFVLSGFLITGILFDSLQSPAYFKNFYMRRALRIFPLYYGFWLLLLLLTPIFHFQWNVQVLSTVGYLGNLVQNASHGASTVLVHRSLGHAGQEHRLIFTHFWSLCVEEQFYLIWPALVFLLRERRRLLQLCLACIVLVPFLRAFVMHRDPQFFYAGGLYFNTFARIDTLLIGAALALWLRGPAPAPAVLRRWALRMAVGTPLLLFALSFWRSRLGYQTFDQHVFVDVGYTIVGLGSAAVLTLAIMPGCRIYRLLRWRPLTNIGRVSYGMYLIHGLLVDPIAGHLGAFKRWHLGLLSPLLGFTLSYVLAQLSFRFLESPFLRLKERFATRPGAIADPPPSGMPLHPERRYARRPTALGAR